MGTMSGPIEYNGFVDDGEPFELIIGDIRPLWELATELLCHIEVAAEEQDAFFGEGRFTHG